MRALLLGFDVSTSSCKVAIFYINGKVVSQASTELSSILPRQGLHRAKS